MTIEKIQLTHTGYIQFLKRIANNDAVRIGELLKIDCSFQCWSAFKTMEELGWTFFTDDCWTQAGELILSNEKIEV